MLVLGCLLLVICVLSTVACFVVLFYCFIFPDVLLRCFVLSFYCFVGLRFPCFVDVLCCCCVV